MSLHLSKDNHQYFPLSKRMVHIDTSAIRQMFDLSSQLKDPINLSIGQPHFPTPTPICEALIKAVKDGKTSYTQTQGILELRERMAQKYEEKNNFKANPEDIIISSGVASLIQLICMACIEPQDCILLTDPCFLIYRSLSIFFGAQIEYIPENFTEEDITQLDSSKLKLIIISNPSNPTGHIQTKEQIHLLAELAEKSGAILVCDEIYELYDYDNSFQSPASYYPKTLTLSGFSKSYSMTGLRLAAATGPKEIIQSMITLQQYTVVCAPTPVQYAGLTALDMDMSHHITLYKNNRDYCLAQLEKENYSGRSICYPAGAFYIFLRLTKEEENADQKFVERAIREKQLLVVPGHIFSRSSQFIRLSYATEEKNIKRGIKALLELL